MISTTTLNAAIENAASLKAEAHQHSLDLIETDYADLLIEEENDVLSCFEVGKTYMTRSIGDHNCIIKVTVASRTKCFITTTEGKRFKVSNDSSTPYNSNTTTHFETIRPWGSFSMCPFIYSTDTKELKKDWEV
tara:strand:+ start:1703 stop:2104 length:402 start_codon:yes stop_codon:yes gene_type:complete